MKYLVNIASIEYAPDKCVGCGMCLEVCPHGVFEMQGNKAVINDKDRCMECSACANNCAVNALRVEKGVGCAAAIIHSMINGGEPTCDCSGKNSSGCC